MAGLAAGWWYEGDAQRLHVQAAGPVGLARVIRVSGLPAGTAVDPGPGPVAWRLQPPWPNPANGTVRVAYFLPLAEHVTLDLYDLNGTRLARLAAGRQPAGANAVLLEADRLASGLYLLRLTGVGWQEIRKLTIVH